MAMELKHLNPQHVMDVTGKAIDEISRLRQENAELKAENERLKEECSRCGKKGQGFSSVLDGSFLCVGCLIKDEVERKFNEVK